MRGFRPLMFSRLNVVMGSVKLLRLAVHRHLPEHREVEPHRHQHAQILLYLTGQGEQEMQGQNHLVSAGSLVMVAAGVTHAFQRATPREPLCLVLDYVDAKADTVQVRLPALLLREVRAALHHLAGLRRAENQVVEAAGWALLLLGKLRTAALLSGTTQPRGGIRARLERRLAEPGAWALPVSVLARRCGYQQDYFNRKVKEETGLTLNQFRARIRLDRARAALAAGERSAEAAIAAGFEEVNYFTRWFKQQTGTTPGVWRQRALGGEVGSARILR
jgi:AraC family transcriptional regulator, transcriptional activator of pobA